MLRLSSGGTKHAWSPRADAASLAPRLDKISVSSENSHEDINWDTGLETGLDTDTDTDTDTDRCG